MLKNPEPVYVAFDLEWTYTKKEQRNGKKKVTTHIIEIGAVKFRGDRVIDTFDSLLAYEGNVDKIVTEITGIDNETLKDAPHRQNTLLKFMLFIENTTLIAHDIKNDIRVLKSEYERIGLEVENPQIDTLRMAKESLPYETLKLSFLNEELGLSTQDKFHRAFHDAKITYLLYKYLLNLEES